MAKPLAKLVALLTPKRSWFQFRLMTVFIVVAVICVWLAVVVNRAHRQRDAVAAIDTLGGGSIYDYQLGAHGNRDPDAEPPGPAWLRESLGIDHLANVVHATLLGDASGLRALKHLRNLPKLTSLCIVYARHPHGTDMLLAASVHLPNLEVLFLDMGNMSDDGFWAIGRLTKLQRLVLVAVDVEDRSLAHLVQLDHLNELRLMGTKTTDAGLGPLRELKALKRLYIEGTDVTAEGFDALAKELPNCEFYFND